MREICTRVKVLVGVRLEEDGPCCEERCISHDGKRSRHIWDEEYGGGGKDAF